MHDVARRRGRALMVAAVVIAGCRRPPPARLPERGDAGPATVSNLLRPCDDVAACEARCREGRAEDCLGAGNGYETGRGAPRDERRATGLFVRSCDLGNGPACTFAGRMYEYAHGVARDLPRALSLYEHACRSGYLGGCYNVAVMLEHGRGAPRDVARAAALYQRVCAGGSPIACADAERLAAALRRADGGAR